MRATSLGRGGTGEDMWAGPAKRVGRETLETKKNREETEEC